MGAAPIGPGDYIECIGAPGLKAHFPGLVAIGRVYRVKEVGRKCSSVEGVVYDSLTVFGVPDVIDGRRVSLPVVAFRPVYRPTTDLIESLLSDIPADAPASPEEVVA